MSIAQELLNSETFLREAYSKLEEKGATMPEKKNLANLASTIENMLSVNFVDYIESSGTQYIDTGYIPSNSTKMILDVQYMTSEDMLNGAWYLDSAVQFGINIKGFHIRYASPSHNEYAIFDKDPTERHLMILDIPNLTAQVDEEAKTLSVKSDFKISHSIYLFAFYSSNNSGNGAGTFCKQKLYSCQIYDSGILVRNFKPCIGPNGVYCLYDLVEQKYYYNQGTGEFLYG